MFDMARKKAVADGPKEYIFRGKLSLSGVEFYITANSEEEAIAKARDGDWHDYDTLGASSEDCNIDLGSCELNQ